MNGTPFKLGTFAKQGGGAFAELVNAQFAPVTADAPSVAEELKLSAAVLEC